MLIKPFQLNVGSAVIHGQYADHLGGNISVIFLHAGVADSRMFSSQTTSLSEHCSVASYDRRGFGRTTAIDEPFSHVEDLCSVIQYLPADTHVLVGCSQGARISIDYAIQYPDAVKALVLVSGTYSGAAFNPNKIEAELMNQIDIAEAANDLDEANRKEAHLWLDGPRREEGYVSDKHRTLFLDMNGIALRADELTQEREPPSVSERISEIQCPVLLIEGDQDVSYMTNTYDHLESNLRYCNRIVVPDVAHLIPMEKPEAFNLLIMNFLTGLR